MDVQRYLDRIHYRGALLLDQNTLSKLQQAHMLAVPFENLSIHYKQPISLDEESLFRKIVENKRGGFCYELNSLFASLLQEIGFTVTKLSAGVITSNGSFGPDFDHMVLLVHLDENYLVDVGFGDSFQQPLLFDKREEQSQGLKSYQITQDRDAYILMEQSNRDAEPGMRPQYRFTLQAHELNAYQGMCNYHQTSPDSHFTQKRICSRATPYGRISLSDLRLIETNDDRRQEKNLDSEEEFLQALTQHFGINL